MRELLEDASERGNRLSGDIWRRGEFSRTQRPLSASLNLTFHSPTQALRPADGARTLDEVGSPATVASAGSRYFGFVIGGSLPATLAAQWLAGAWDQNAGLVSRIPNRLRSLKRFRWRWLLDVLDLPAETGVGFVTGATMANFTALAAARHALLAAQNWDVEAQGLFGAPLSR